MVFLDLKASTELPPGYTALIRLNIHQNNIRSDPAYTMPRDHIIIPAAHQPHELSRSRHHNGAHTPLRHFYPYIANISQPPPVTDADDLLAMQIRELHRHTSTPKSFGKIYAPANNNMQQTKIVKFAGGK